MREVSWTKPAADSMKDLYTEIYTNWVRVGRSGACMVEPVAEHHTSSLSPKERKHRKVRNRIAMVSRRKNR